MSIDTWNLKKMLCKVCNVLEAKYKCSSCYSPYCSLVCWKNHKSSNNCQPLEKKKEEVLKPPKIDRKYFTEDTVSPENLKKLGENKKIRNMLKNKYLQQTLLAVEYASNPEKAIFEAMKDPDFVNFVDECLKNVEND